MEYIILGVLLVIIFMLYDKLTKLEMRFKSMKATLDQIALQVEIPEHPINDELRKLLKEGKDVQAVKKAREVLGLSLLEAKQYVDAL
ncbi:hypothetical protein I6J18_01365 [Peribacillus psychrosaccharolyticus]|uniref:Ribosomal protein L7/L12 C-terminal domain-containing protein n=2 Tax=Peribacillus psychrosaccharolyticus TaxID=1407 RepID=A0A974NRL0_PERPY|nr:hypothetical protein [Peribacillus psychrosaccharolyticus]MEC2056195.1 hypothetical protein [Peribacillus psychrosaccharolyticus]MED3743599.1 hypothetical protein [Peribacillus psychrosaccharolyticus]QQT02483.1 hypothetical protein I6J18_01365 [Peribacillus psychrosaccharolyticus]